MGLYGCIVYIFISPMVHRRWIRYTLWILILRGGPHIEGSLLFLLVARSALKTSLPQSRPSMEDGNVGKLQKMHQSRILNSCSDLLTIGSTINNLNTIQILSALFFPTVIMYVLTSENRCMITKVLLRSKITDVRVLRLEMALAELIPSLFFSKNKFFFC